MKFCEYAWQLFGEAEDQRLPTVAINSICGNLLVIGANSYRLRGHGLLVPTAENPGNRTLAGQLAFFPLIP